MTIIQADILKWAETYTGPKFHAMLCDAPYELGFMNRDWDRSGISFQSSTWAAIAQHLYPGAFGMTFAGSRTYHRIACAIEDAGLIIHPVVLAWSFGSGFPKATRVGKRIKINGKTTIQPDLRFAGHRYGMQSLKPAIEPLITFVKPLNKNRFSAIICQISVLLEGLTCILLPAPAAELITNHLHRDLKAVVDSFARQYADVWESLETVRIAGESSASSLATLTLQSFVAGPAPTPGAMRQLVQTILIGDQGHLSAKDTDTSDSAMVDILESIAWSWSKCSADLLSVLSTSTTETETSLTTDLQILRSLIEQSIHAATMPLSNQHGLLSSVHTVAMSLQSVIIKLPLLGGISAPASATGRCVVQDSGPAASPPSNSLTPIIVFQKPYEGSPLACITSTGAGALWIDGGRIGTEEMVPRNNMPGQNGIFNASGGIGNGGIGRWPANLVLSHHPACDGECVPGCPVARLGAQSGESSSSASPRNRVAPKLNGVYGHADRADGDTLGGHDDTGTAARFFHQSDWMYERLELADAIQYVAKASRSEREAGLDPRQTAIMRLMDDSDDWDEFEDAETSPIYGNETPEGAARVSRRPRHGFDSTTVDDGRETPIDNPYQRGETTRRNTHPTIKPISLARHLATLLLPPAEYGPRRLLVPFAGAGSEVIGADLAGWEEVTGIELEADHVAIANARRAYWQQRRWELGGPARKLTVRAAPKVPAGQIDMFTEEAA